MRRRDGGPSETVLRGRCMYRALDAGEPGGRKGAFEGRVVRRVEDDLGLVAFAAPLVLGGVFGHKGPYSTRIRGSPDLTV